MMVKVKIVLVLLFGLMSVLDIHSQTIVKKEKNTPSGH